MLFRSADPAVQQDDLARQFSAMQGALAKVHLIGGHPTLSAVGAFSVELSSAVLELSLGRLPLLQKQADIKILDDQIRVSGQERDRMVQLMKELNFAGDHEPHRWKLLQDTFQFEQGRVSKSLDEQAELRAQFGREWLAYVQLCYKTVARLSQHLVPAISAAREELDLPFDAEKYRQLVDASLERQRQMLDEFVRRLQAQEGS